LGHAQRGGRQSPVPEHMENSENGTGAQPAIGRAAGFWNGCGWIACQDGKMRPVEPGVLPLADGVPRRLELLRGYGNAIVPPLAAEFVKAYMEPVAKSFCALTRSRAWPPKRFMA
jgi:DNA (cytosine-5)-methyltransferase 1